MLMDESSTRSTTVQYSRTMYCNATYQPMLPVVLVQLYQSGGGCGNGNAPADKFKATPNFDWTLHKPFRKVRTAYPSVVHRPEYSYYSTMYSTVEQ